MKQKQDITYRFLYGRIVPGNFKNNKWTAPNNSFKKTDHDFSFKIHYMTLHASADIAGALVKQILQGETLFQASINLGIAVDNRLEAEIGSFAISKTFFVRPVMHLPPRGSFIFSNKRISPISSTSVDSAAFSVYEKANVLNFNVPDSTVLLKTICETMDSETGMDFSKKDFWRFGDLEVLNPPGLTPTQNMKCTFLAGGKESILTLHERIASGDEDNLVILKTYSDTGIMNVYTSTIDRHISYPHSITFQISELENNIASGFTLEVYAMDGVAAQASLLIQKEETFAGSIHISPTIVGGYRNLKASDWLSKEVPAKDLDRLAQQEKIKRMEHSSLLKIEGRIPDPWVGVHYALEDKISSLLPIKSDGAFFPRLSNSKGSSRIALLGWLDETFSKHINTQVIWFDPFMEDVGVDILNRLGTWDGEYIIITGDLPEKSLFEQCRQYLAEIKDFLKSDFWEKQSRKKLSAELRKPGRIKNLIAACNKWKYGFGSIRLRVVALNPEKIHDRMILIRSHDGTPIAGYHFSNSIQRANDSHPLLVTPIPPDLLSSTYHYIDQILHGSKVRENDIPNYKILFDSDLKKSVNEDSTNLSQSPLDMKRSGDVISWWLEKEEFKGLFSESLKDELKKFNLIDGEKLNGKDFDKIPNKFWNEGFVIEDFPTAWDALGQILAYTNAGDSIDEVQLSISSALTKSLSAYLDSSRSSALPPPTKITNLDIHYYLSQDTTNLLMSFINFEVLASSSTTEVSYGDYYSIKVMWSGDPRALVRWIENEIDIIDVKNLRQQAILACAIRWVAFTFLFQNDHVRSAYLIKSKIPLLKWIGFNGLRLGLNESIYDIDLIKTFFEAGDPLILDACCWLLREAKHENSKFIEVLSRNLITNLPETMDDKLVKHILNLLRGPGHRLFSPRPWILETFLIPAISQGKMTASQVAAEWMEELSIIWNKILDSDKHTTFRDNSEGVFSEELVVLYSVADSKTKELIIATCKKIASKCLRVIRTPFSSQKDYKLYSCAHNINLWIYYIGRGFLELSAENKNSDLQSLVDDGLDTFSIVSESNRDAIFNKELLRFSLKEVSFLHNLNILHLIQFRQSRKG